MDYKEYLDKAKIKQLAELQERYNQVYAKERAEAASGLRSSFNQYRRGLQNVGLASRKGKLISGKEKTAALAARRQYRDYNTGLSRVARAYTTAAGRRMANQTLLDQNRAERADAYKKWGDDYAQQVAEAKAEYEAKLQEIEAQHLAYANEYQQNYDDYKAQLAAYQQQLQQYQQYLQQLAAQQQAEAEAQQQAQQTKIPHMTTGGRIGGLINDTTPTVYNEPARTSGNKTPARTPGRVQVGRLSPQLTDQRPLLAETNYSVTQAQREQEAAWLNAQAALKEQQALQAKIAAASKITEPRTSADMAALQEAQYAQNKLFAMQQEAKHQQDVNKWNDAIRRAEGITKPTNRYENEALKEAAQAKQQWLKYEQEQAALRLPSEYRNLVTLSDSEFKLRYDAAEQAYKNAVQNANILRKDSASSMDDLSSEANDIEGKATSEFVKWQQAAAARADAQTAFYADSVQPDMTLAPHAPAWASVTNHNGKNFENAQKNHWDATDYAKDNNTYGSKYTALINEWSLINGRTALNYTQAHAIAGLGRNILSGGKEGQQYDAFVANCGAVFYNAPEGLEKTEREQMEALLTLANLMTDEERARFNTILKTQGATEADKYFEFLYESVLPTRFDDYVNNENAFQARDSIGRVRQSIYSVPVNIAQSIPGVVHTLFTPQNDPIAAKLSAAKYNLAQNQRNQIGQQYSNIVTAGTANLGKGFSEWAGNAANFLYGTGMSMADSATVALISGGIGEALQGAGVAAEMATKIGSAIGGTLLGGSAFNASYQEALQNGLSPDKARMTAVGNGINEMLFETLSIGTLLEKTGKSVLKPTKNAWVNLFVNSAVQAGVEGSEEVFTDIANKIWDNKINGVFSEEMQKIREYVASGMTFAEAKEAVNREFAEQLGMSFLGGAISGGFMGSGAQVLNNFQMRKVDTLGKDIANGKVQGVDVNALQNFGYKSEAAQEILNSGKLTNQDIGTLALIRNQEAVQAANEYIKQAVLEGKMPQRIADLYNKYAEYGLQSEVNGKIVNEQGVTFDEALEMFKYSGVIQNGNLIRQGLGAIVNASEAANKTISEADAAFDKKVQAIQSNPVLSEQGKAQQIQKADQERMNAVNAAMQTQREETQKAVPQNPVRAEAQMSANRRFTAQDTNVNFNRSNLKVNAENRMVETKNGSLTYDFDGRNELSQMSKEQRAALDFSKYFAEKFGVNVNIAQHFVGNKVAENGAYDAKTNTIYIDLSRGATNSLVYTAAHELTHWLKENNQQAFGDLRDAIKENLTRIDLTSDELPDLYNLAGSESEGIMDAVASTDNLWEALNKYEANRYEEAGMYHDAQSIEEEVVCRCCESFLSREAFVREMAKQHFKSARSIMEFFNSLKEDIDTLRGAAKERVSFADESPENEFMQRYTEIERIAGLWSRIVNETAERSPQIRTEMEAEELSDVNTKYSLRTKDAPTKTGIAYKVFVAKDGQLYPPMVANPGGAGTPVGVWLDADAAKLAGYSKEGRPQVESGGKGTSTGRGKLAYRPGWHLGDLPKATQFLRVDRNNRTQAVDKDGNLKYNKEGKPVYEKNAFPANFVWAECEYAMDVDYQDEAMSYGYTKNGKFRHSYAGLPKLPTDGFYRYRTNPNPETVPWVITGAMRVNRILTDAEVNSILQENGVEPVPRVGGEIDLAKYGLKAGDTRQDISVKSETTEKASLAVQFKMTESGATRTFELGDATARMIGNTVDLNGGTQRQRVAMMQQIADRYERATVDAASEAEANAFVKAGAQRIADSDTEYGTFEFRQDDSRYKTDSQFDTKQKAKFAKDVLKQIGSRRNFTDAQITKYRNALERTMGMLWEATHGKGDQMAAFDAADRLFDRMLDNYSALTEADAEMRDMLLENMPKQKDAKGRTYRVLEVTATQMSEIRNAYDNAKTYSQKLSNALGTRVFVKEVQNAKTLEDIFTHSTDSRISNDIVEGDMPNELLRLSEQTKEQRTNPYKGESDERNAVKESMWDAALNMVGAEKSTTQKVRDAVKEARAEERKAAKDKLAKAVDDARLAERMHEGALRAKDRRVAASRETELKRRAVERELKLKETTQQKMAQQKVEMIRRDVKKTALKWNQRLVKMLANPTEASHIPVQLAQEVAAFTKTLTEYLDNGTQRGQLNLERIMKAYDEAVKADANIQQMMEAEDQFKARGEEAFAEGLFNDVELRQDMDELNKLIKDKDIKDLNPFELRELLDVVRGVAYSVYNANRMIGQKENIGVWTVRDQMAQDLKKVRADQLNIITRNMLDFRRMMKIISGSNENAVLVQLANELNEGAIEKERIALALKSMFDPMTQKYGEEIRKWYGKDAEWINTGITFNGKKVEITKGMRVALALHIMNEGNMRHIENGGLTIPNRELYRKGDLANAYTRGTTVTMTAEQIDKILSGMTKAEKEYVKIAAEFFHERAGYYINRTSLQLLGYRKAKVENYFPIHTNRDYTKTDFVSVMQSAGVEGWGSLKDRIEGASNAIYLEDITSVINRQIDGVSMYAGLAIPMRNWNAVMNASSYVDGQRMMGKAQLGQVIKSEDMNVIKGFLADLTESTKTTVTAADKWIGRLSTNYVKAVLLGNLKVAMKQVASYPTAAAVIPWKYLAQGLTAGKVDIDLINQYTPLYNMRREGQANEIASIMQKRGLEQKLPWLLGWITKMDVATVGRIWKAAEYMVADQQKNLPVGSDEYYKAVAEVFNDTVQQTQPNFTPLQRGAALRSKNPVVRSLVLFGTQRMQNGNIILEAAYELRDSKGKSKEEIKSAKQKLVRAVSSQIVQNILLIVASLGVDALRGRMKGWQDDDKNITPESLAKGMGDMFLSNLCGSFLFGSEVYDTISAWFKDDAYDTEFTVPALEAAEFILNYVRKELPNTVKYLTSSKNTVEDKLAKAKSSGMKLVKAAGYATGIPFENAYKDLMNGIIPMIKDIQDWAKTGELIPYLHQSGKLDNKKTSERYKEWIDSGRKGSEFFYWQNKLKGVSKRDDRIAILAAEDIPNDEKAMLAAMFDTSGAYAEGTQMFRSNGKLYYDFANAEPISPVESTLNDIAEATAAPTPEPTAEPTATPVPLSDKKLEGVQEAVKKGVPEELAVDAFLAYQDIGKQSSYDDDWSRNDQFREWLFKNVDDPNQRAILEYQVVGQATRVEGAVTYRATGTVYRDFTNEAWYELSGWNLASDGTNKRYEAGKLLEQTGMSVDKTVEIYRGLADYTKKAEWTQYMKEQGLTDEQITIILWSRGWAKR